MPYKLFSHNHIRLLKYTIFLLLPFKDISLRPELSSPPRFRIQGGLSERDTAEEQEQDRIPSF